MTAGAVVLVGESNPYGGHSYFALYPEPARSAGGRLCALVLGLSPREYLSRYDRVNLVSGRWSAARARERAEVLLAAGGRAVLLGKRVADAFGARFEPFTVQTLRRGEAVLTVAVLPHPSGRCRMWSDPASFGRARETVARLEDTP